MYKIQNYLYIIVYWTLGLCVDCFQVVFLRPIRAGFWKKPKGKNGHFT